MTLNLQHHLRRPEEAWRRCMEGLGDDSVKVGRKLSLWLRIEKIASDKKESRFVLEDVPQVG